MIKIRRKKRLFEGAPAPAAGGDANAQATAQGAQQPAAPAGGDANAQATAQGAQQPATSGAVNYAEIPGQMNTFLATLFNNIKKACAWEAMTKAIPALANEQDEKLKDPIGKLKAADEAFATGDELKPDDAEGIKKCSEAYSAFITALTEFNTAIAEVAKAGGAAPAQGAQQPTAQPAAQ